MIPFSHRVNLAEFVLLFITILTPGCRDNPTAQAMAQAASASQRIPTEVQLSEPEVTLLEPTICRFKVKYRFLRGKPDQFYACEISFPGTRNHGVKLMESWELKQEGVIEDKIMLSQPGAKSFEIRVSESPSPRQPYKKISNVVSGSIP